MYGRLSLPNIYDTIWGLKIDEVQYPRKERAELIMWEVPSGYNRFYSPKETHRDRNIKTFLSLVQPWQRFSRLLS